MATPDDSAGERFTMTCVHCARELLGRRAWIGRDVQCPHCTSILTVPEPAPPGQETRAEVSASTAQRRFSFSCPRCQSLLESHAGMCGHPARCPTCNANLAIPPSPRVGAGPPKATLAEQDLQDPTPMHAYAASGHQAPRLCRRTNGELAIECPRCEALCDISVNSCPSCGVPFTIDGVPTVTGKPGNALAVTSLVLGILAVPMFAAVVLGPLALVFGMISWFQRARAYPSGKAIAGMLLGMLGSWISLSMLT
jgi:hypothetical protein